MINPTSLPEFSHFPVMLDEVIKICSDYNIGVIGTKATIGSGIYESKIKSKC